METQVDQKTIDEWRELGKKSLFFLARGILGFGDMTVEIHKPVCDTLQDYKKNTRAMVVFPRTWFKSTMASIAYPIWRAINNPNIRILIAQNSYSNACKKLAAIKAVFEKNDLFRALYPEILPNSSCTWSRECLTVNRTAAHPEGTFEAAGIGTATTSRHYDLILEDDTIAPKKDDMTGIVQQPTQLDIEKAIGWHRLAHPLLLHPSKSQIVIIGTRWAERDLIGWIKKNAPEFVVLSQAACEDSTGNPCHYNNADAIITWPERFSLEVLKELEVAEGPYMFASLYLNSPSDAINQVFKREWIRYYQNTPKDCVFCTSVDLASAEKEESSDPDFNVVLTTGVSPSRGEIYVQLYDQRRMPPGDVIDSIFNHYNVYKQVQTKVESIGYQRTLVYWLQKKMKALSKLFYIDEVKSLKGSKVDRIRALQPYFAAGKIHIKTGHTELEHELLAFPKGAHDDIIDALSMQVDFWYEVISRYEEGKKKEITVDPFSGDAVIGELRGRPTKLHQYPFDMGIMADREHDDQLREYAGVYSA